MYQRTGMARILIVLLVLRVVAAPIALRPDTPRHSTNDRFVVRVCSWPVQRALRPASFASLIVRPRGAAGGRASDWFPSPRHQARGEFQPQAILSRSRLWSATNTPPVHLTDCPRC